MMKTSITLAALMVMLAATNGEPAISHARNENGNRVLAEGSVNCGPCVLINGKSVNPFAGEGYDRIPTENNCGNGAWACDRKGNLVCKNPTAIKKNKNFVFCKADPTFVGPNAFDIGSDGNPYSTAGYFPPPEDESNCPCGDPYPDNLVFPDAIIPITAAFFDQDVLEIIDAQVLSLPIQEYDKNINSFTIDRVVYSLDSLEPCKITDAGLIVQENGVNMNTLGRAATVVTCREGYVKGTTILVLFDEDGSVTNGLIKPDGQPEISLVATKIRNQLATVKAADYDPEFFGQFNLADPLNSTERRRLRLEGGSLRGQSAKIEVPSPERQLTHTCDNDVTNKNNVYKVIEIAVHYDSSFCQAAGGNPRLAQRKVEEVLRFTSLKYQVSPICAIIKLVFVDGWCEPASDPFLRSTSGGVEIDAESLSSNYSVFFQQKDIFDAAARVATVERDVALFFTAQRFQDSVVGIAYGGGLCDNVGQYGAVNIFFSKNILAQAVVVAHEIGHSIGATHLENENYDFAICGPQPSVNITFNCDLFLNNNNNLDTEGCRNQNFLDACAANNNLVECVETRPLTFDCGDLLDNNPAIPSICKRDLTSWCVNFAVDNIDQVCTVDGPPCHIMYESVALPSSSFITSSIGIINAKLETASCISLGDVSDLDKCGNGILDPGELCDGSVMDINGRVRFPIFASCRGCAFDDNGADDEAQRLACMQCSSDSQLFLFDDLDWSTFCPGGGIAQPEPTLKEPCAGISIIYDPICGSVQDWIFAVPGDFTGCAESCAFDSKLQCGPSCVSYSDLECVL